MSRTPARPQAPARGPKSRPAARAGAAAVGTSLPERAAALATQWAPAAGRVLLAIVLAWFGYHELVRPGLWTGYVPIVSPTSSLAVVAVLAHGWVLLMLAVALAAGIATRLAALLSAAVLLEIIISLLLTAGMSDLTMRDIGVFGLAVCLTGISNQRLALRR